MKKVALFLSFFLSFVVSFGQGNNNPKYYFAGSMSLGQGINKWADSCALLHIGPDSAKAGILFPRVYDTLLITSPKEGLGIYYPPTNKFMIYDGSQWRALGEGGGGSDSNTFIGTLAQARSLTISPNLIITKDYGGGTWFKNDTVTVDNTGTQIITAGGQGYSRVWDNENIYVSWFSDTLSSDLSTGFIPANNYAKSGNKVIVTQGDYRMLNPITTKSGVYYDFTGAKVSVNTKVSTRKWITLDNVTGVTIDGIELTDTNTSDVGFSSGIYILGGKDNTISNCDVSGFWETNVRIDSSINFLVEKSKFYNCFYRGLRTAYYSTGKISQCESYNNVFHGFYLSSGQIEISNCYAYGNGQYGIFSFQDTLNSYRNKLSVINNRSSNNTLCQISLDYYTDNAIIRGNICVSATKTIPSLEINASTAALGYTVKNIVVENNTLDSRSFFYRVNGLSIVNNNAYQFAVLACNSANVSNNRMLMADTNSIYVINFDTYGGTNTSNISVENNLIEKGKRTGIKTNNIEGYLNIQNNRIKFITPNGGFGEAIRIENSISTTNNVIENNVVDSQANFGIRVTSSIVKATQNTITGGLLYSIGGTGLIVSDYNGENRIVYGTAIPSTGSWIKNDMAINSNFSSTSTYAWICTASGSPGTWTSVTPNLQSVTNQGFNTTTGIAVDVSPNSTGFFLRTTGGVNRHIIRGLNAETGSNEGSDFAINTRDDAGGSLSNPFIIKRSTGNTGIGATPTSNKLTVGGNTLINGSVRAVLPSYISGGYVGVIQTPDSIFRQIAIYSKGQVDSINTLNEKLANKVTTLSNSPTQFPSTSAIRDSIYTKSFTYTKAQTDSAIAAGGDFLPKNFPSNQTIQTNGRNLNIQSYGSSYFMTMVLDTNRFVIDKNGVGQFSMDANDGTIISDGTTKGITLDGTLFTSSLSDTTSSLVGATDLEDETNGISKLTIMGKKGSASVATGTSATIPHSLLTTPAQVLITMTSPLPQGTTYYISDKTSTTFTITWSSSVTSPTFDWVVYK